MLYQGSEYAFVALCHRDSGLNKTEVYSLFTQESRNKFLPLQLLLLLLLLLHTTLSTTTTTTTGTS